MRAMRRSGAAATALATTLLGGCYLGPLPVQYAALAVIDGRPTAVVAVCGRPTVHVDVYLDDNNTDPDLHEWSVTVTLPNTVQDVEVELLGSARPGWEITSKPHTIGSPPGGFKVTPLTSIDPGHHYKLDSSSEGPEGSMAPPVMFTTDDLSRIGAGEVLTAIDRK